jgi:hypothetical protein
MVCNRKFLYLEIFRCKNQSCGWQPSVLLGTSDIGFELQQQGLLAGST